MYEYDTEMPKNQIVVGKKSNAERKQYRLLGLTMVWFSLGVFITILFSGIIASIPQVSHAWLNFLVQKQLNPNIFIYSSIGVEFVLCFIFQMFFTYRRIDKVNTFAALIGYFIYVFVSTLALTFMTLSLNSIRGLNAGNVVLIFIIPAVLFTIVGALGYFGKVNFSKLWWIVIVGFVATILMWLVSFFTTFRNNKIWSFYLVLMIIVSLVIIGINFQMMKNFEQGLNNNDYEDNKKLLMNSSIMFGFNLYLLFVGLIWKVLSLIMRK